ncbi:hypothetical protein ATCV1_z623L [Acanthocystis turfacea chlorella virus 1]|uniref:Uncharacterized protein z623L n=1 Tax=Chlorovirus heliozoae TaxID=322019 RepID=A7K9N3_9PHYC|nr:hypothetical protein ATCV1_z623L [Acanthocystis turfacea chlorella virus 1]ABT16757.1 hypothetical protein ATCV1_z623L [Acanthocystis turfacea chlorella virus 1]
MRRFVLNKNRLLYITYFHLDLDLGDVVVWDDPGDDLAPRGAFNFNTQPVRGETIRRSCEPRVVLVYNQTEFEMLFS